MTISHLLSKNHVADLIGRSAYTLVTESAVAQLDIPWSGSPITEQYEHYAPVRARPHAAKLAVPLTRLVVLQGQRGDARAR